MGGATQENQRNSRTNFLNGKNGSKLNGEENSHRNEKEAGMTSWT